MNVLEKILRFLAWTIAVLSLLAMVSCGVYVEYKKAMFFINN